MKQDNKDKCLDEVIIHRKTDAEVKAELGLLEQYLKKLPRSRVIAEYFCDFLQVFLLGQSVGEL